jgi:hypothetical protein
MSPSSTTTTFDVGRGPGPTGELSDVSVCEGVFSSRADSDGVIAAIFGGNIAEDPGHPGGGGGGGGGPLGTCPGDGPIHPGGGGGGGRVVNGLDLDRGGGGRLLMISTSLSLPELLEDEM